MLNELVLLVPQYEVVERFREDKPHREPWPGTQLPNTENGSRVAEKAATVGYRVAKCTTSACSTACVSWHPARVFVKEAKEEIVSALTAISAKLELEARTLQQHATLLFYASTHGERKHGPKAELQMALAKRDTYITLGELEGGLSGSRWVHTVLVLDVCGSGDASVYEEDEFEALDTSKLGRTDVEKAIRCVGPRPHVTILAASSADGEALHHFVTDTAAPRGGFFTVAFCEWLGTKSRESIERAAMVRAAPKEAALSKFPEEVTHALLARDSAALQSTTDSYAALLSEAAAALEATTASKFGGIWDIVSPYLLPAAEAPLAAVAAGDLGSKMRYAWVTTTGAAVACTQAITRTAFHSALVADADAIAAAQDACARSINSLASGYCKFVNDMCEYATRLSSASPTPEAVRPVVEKSVAGFIASLNDPDGVVGNALVELGLELCRCSDLADGPRMTTLQAASTYSRVACERWHLPAAPPCAAESRGDWRKIILNAPAAKEALIECGSAVAVYLSSARALQTKLSAAKTARSMLDRLTGSPSGAGSTNAGSGASTFAAGHPGDGLQQTTASSIPEPTAALASLNAAPLDDSATPGHAFAFSEVSTVLQFAEASLAKRYRQLVKGYFDRSAKLLKERLESHQKDKGASIIDGTLHQLLLAMIAREAALQQQLFALAPFGVPAAQLGFSWTSKMNILRFKLAFCGFPEGGADPSASSAAGAGKAAAAGARKAGAAATGAGAGTGAS